MTIKDLTVMADAPPGYYTEAEWAEMLGVTIPTLRAQASRRRGAPRTRIGRRVLYRIDACQSWLRAREKDFDQDRDRRLGATA